MLRIRITDDRRLRINEATVSWKMAVSTVCLVGELSDNGDLSPVCFWLQSPSPYSISLYHWLFFYLLISCLISYDRLGWLLVSFLSLHQKFSSTVVVDCVVYPVVPVSCRSWRCNLAHSVCVLVSTSVEHVDAPLMGGVRAVTLASRHLVEPCGSGRSRLTHIGRVDFRLIICLDLILPVPVRTLDDESSLWSTVVANSLARSLPTRWQLSCIAPTDLRRL